MGDAAMRDALDQGGIVIEPRPTELKAASVDLRLGPEAFLGTSDAIVDLTERRLLVIPPGELVLVTTAEKMIVGAQYAAQIGLRSFYARKGLALLSGPQVDPGFRGRLHVALVNLSPVEISIAHEEPLVTLVFHDLGKPVEKPYGAGKGDEYSEQDRITGVESDDIRQHRGYAMSEVIREMASLSSNVGELRTSVDGYIKQSDKVMSRTSSYMAIFVGAVVSLVLAVVSILIVSLAT